MDIFKKLVAFGALVVMMSTSSALFAATEVTGEDDAATVEEVAEAGEGYTAGAAAPVIGAEAIAGAALTATVAGLALTNTNSSTHSHSHSH